MYIRIMELQLLKDKLHQNGQAEVAELLQEGESPEEGVQVAVVQVDTLTVANFIALAKAASDLQVESTGDEPEYLEALTQANDLANS